MSDRVTEVIVKVRKHLAARLRLIAARLDPPTEPYGEWDKAKGCLVVRIPDGHGHSMPLAHVNVSSGDIRM